MKFKEYTESHKTLREDNRTYPFLIKALKNIYKETVNVWVSEKTDTNDLFLDISGEPQFYEKDIDLFVKAIKDAKKHIQRKK